MGFKARRAYGDPVKAADMTPEHFADGREWQWSNESTVRTANRRASRRPVEGLAHVFYPDGWVGARGWSYDIAHVDASSPSERWREVTRPGRAR